MEKERYEQVGYEEIRDNQVENSYNLTISDSVNRLNQQDKRIKELEEENQQLKQEVNNWKQRFEASEKRYQTLQEHFVKVSNLKNNKIKQLKQSQNNKTIAVLERLKNYFDDKDDGNYNESEGWIITNRNVVEYVDKQIKELKGE